MTYLGVDEPSSVPWAAIAPLAVLGIAFLAYCLYDLSRSDVRHVPKWAWALICVVSIPFGGIVYLMIGRDRK